jgi:hypothetical protein
MERSPPKSALEWPSPHVTSCMAFVPGVANDLFVSYDHADDGDWLRAFERNLRREVSSRLGQDVEFWQDVGKLRAGGNWEQAIAEAIDKTATFLAILSPSYRDSEWCSRERDRFRKLFSTPDEFASARRFFKIVKTPWTDNAHRRFLPSIQDEAAFCALDDNGIETVEFMPGTAEFQRCIVRVAAAVAQTLAGLRRQRERVYVAYVQGDDCDEARKALRRELHELGYDVQPTGPRDDAFDADTLRKEMEGARLSIHLMGGAFHPVKQDLVRLASELEQPLMFWFAAGAEQTSDSQQRAVLDLIRNGKVSASRALPAGWTVLPGIGSRMLIEEVRQALRPRSAVAPVRGMNGARRVYIYCDPSTGTDAVVASRLRDELQANEGMQVFLPASSVSSPAEAINRHEALLRDCDGVLLFRHEAPDHWLVQAMPDLLWAERRVTGSRVKSKALLLPDVSQWSGYPGVTPIAYRNDVSVRDLDPFLIPLRAGA